jgi:hypothetical protein
MAGKHFFEVRRPVFIGVFKISIFHRQLKLMYKLFYFLRCKVRTNEDTEQPPEGPVETVRTNIPGKGPFEDENKRFEDKFPQPLVIAM